MYTDRVDATEEELNERIPLSIARWHQHINFCKAPKVQKAAYFGRDAKFGLRGSIKSKETCEAADGEFFPTFLDGWCTSTRMRPIHKKIGQLMMTTRDTKTWITRPCQG